MAKTIIINGVVYNDVKELNAPLASDPSAKAIFVETSDADAEAENITKNMMAYVKGKKVVGTHTDPTFSLANSILTIT